MERLDWSAAIEEIALRSAMPVESAKQDRSRRRQKAILDAAIHIFARDGVARARISDIAAKAGVPLSSVYDYHPTKEDLAFAVPVTRMGRFYEEFLAKARPLETAEQRLRLFLWLTADFARRNPKWARILYLEVWPSVMIRQVTVRTTIDDFARILILLIRDGERTGEWPRGPGHYETASILIGSVSQLLITWLLYGRPRDLMAATDSLIERLMPLLHLASFDSPKARRQPSLCEETRAATEARTA